MFRPLITRLRSHGPIYFKRSYAKKPETIRGMADLYGHNMAKHAYIIDKAIKASKTFGFEEISFLLLDNS